MAKPKDEKNDKVKDVSKKDGKKEKKERKPREGTRVLYPLKEGTKLTEVPEDFSFDKHWRIKKNFFEHEWKCLEHRADEAQWMVGHLRKKAKQMKELGGTKNRTRMSRLQKMQAKMAELRAELEGAGIDVDGLLEAEAPAEKS